MDEKERVTTIEAETKKNLSHREMEAIKKKLKEHHFFAKISMVTL